MSVPFAVASTMLLVQADEGLTLREIIGSLPTDPASLVALLLMLAFVVVIGYFGLRSSEPEPGPDPEVGPQAPGKGKAG